MALQPIPKIAAVSDRPLSQLEVALEQVSKASREVMALVHDLTVCLDPVLLPHPGIAEDRVAEKGPECSQLTAGLRERAAFLRGTASELRALLDRLEV